MWIAHRTKRTQTRKDQLKSDENQKLSVMIRTLFYVFCACKCHFKLAEEM